MSTVVNKAPTSEGLPRSLQNSDVTNVACSILLQKMTDKNVNHALSK